MLLLGPAQSATFPTCAYFSLKVPCFNVTTDIGDAMVNVRVFGAKGDGTTDDTNAIQAAIDYAYNNHIQGIYCPSGDYRTTTTIYLDAPGNLRAHLASPTIFSFSLAFIGSSDGIGNHEGFGCRIKPTFDNATAFMVGTGQHMHVSGISIIGPNPATYRCNFNTSGIGLAIAGGSAGPSDTLIENVLVENFYYLTKTAANGNANLGDSNAFRKFNGNNGCLGITISQTQNDINSVFESRISGTTTAFWSQNGRPITVVGGNFSATSGVSASFGISSISSFSKVVDGQNFDYTFTGVLASPDSYVANVYNSWTIVTSHFGVVPLTVTNWNSGTNTATFQIYPAWVFANFRVADLTTASDLQAEVAAATKVYAAERVTVATGDSISMEGIHIENPNACTTFYEATTATNGATRSTIKNPFFNYDPGFHLYGPSNSPTDGQLAVFYCQQQFPFINQVQFPSGLGTTAYLTIDGGDYGMPGTNTGEPILIQQGPNRFFSARALSEFGPFNMRLADTAANAITVPGQLASQWNEVVVNGAGEWDADYDLPPGISSSTNIFSALTHGPLTSPMQGYFPAPWTEPNLNPTLFALVCIGGSVPCSAFGTPALGSYPPIACNTAYKSIDYNSSALTKLHARSASCPGWSYGQDLVDAAVGGTVTWSYKGGSAMLYLDAKTLSWMRPGLGFKLSGGGGDGSGGVDQYIVTGVYPQAGYITAFDITALTALPGTKTTVYSCSSSCHIKQTAYSWTQY